ncbi:hypothetical protein [Providencia burhodogranariea]|uniref:Uncharacterized protein n=1 Tax=Providencia burhodogranariea DSM 19968 TaxID=1141662 RepID=K8VY11_9GAMM|nr:hypothetical protein OOA_19264 [Providencia burhodogranariea DSM 19968]
MDFDSIILLLSEVGIPKNVLSDADGSWQLRRDLSLSSAETVALQARLQQQTGKLFSLWGNHDYSLDEIISLVN